MRRFIPANSQRNKGSGSQIHQQPRETNTNINGQEQSVAEFEKSGSESELEDTGDKLNDPGTSGALRPERGLRRTGVAFTSGEIAAMSHEELVQKFKEIQGAKISNEPEAESGDLALADHPRAIADATVANADAPVADAPVADTPIANAPVANANDLVPSSLTKQQCHTALINHARKTFQTMRGSQAKSNTYATIRDANGVVQHWTPNEHGVKELTPAWDQSLDKNLESWKSPFLNRCRVESEMPPLARSYLKTVIDEVFIKALRQGAWKTYSGYAKQAANGTLVEKQGSKREDSRNTQRQITKASQRVKAGQGTCVDSNLHEFAFLYRPCAQSLPAPDSLNPNQKIFLVPSFIANEVLTIKDSLDLKASANAKSSKAKDKAYVRVNGPVTKLLNDFVWPDWAISKSWKETHPEDYSKSVHLIEPKLTVMPDITEFTGRYKAPARTFLPSMPLGVQGAEENRRSVSPGLGLVPEDGSMALSNSTTPMGESVPAEQAPAKLPVTTPAKETLANLEPLPPPVVTQPVGANSGQHNCQLNGGYFVDGEFVPSSSITGPTGAAASKQVFGVPIDPKLPEQDHLYTASTSTSGQPGTSQTPSPKRALEATTPTVNSASEE